MIFLFLFLLFLIALLLFATFPDPGRRQICREFAQHPFAHRGLWDMEQQIPENSLPAFARAAEHNFGIELDVHLTADGKLVVFHDDTLQRMCGLNESVEKLDYDTISGYPLLETDCHAPLLSDVLSLVDGRVPLLIEMKIPGRDLSLCPALADLLKDYSGAYMIESFHPFGLRWFRRNRKEILRGQLSARYKDSESLSLPLKIASTQLMLNFISRPDFIAYNYKHYGTFGSVLQARIFRTPFWVWTIRSERAFRKCQNQFTGVIFEKLSPAYVEERHVHENSSI